MAEGMGDDVTIIRKKQPKASSLKTPQAINAAQRQGLEIETSKKFAAGQNKQHLAAKNTAKLDRETEELHHDTVGLDIGRLIQQGRQGKGWTQKDLATNICEKPQVVNEYESGKAIPNQAVLTKMERALGMKLRGKERGQPIAPKDKGQPATAAPKKK